MNYTSKLTTCFKDKNIYDRSLFSLLVLWFLVFPVQGAFYQASIYLIPLLLLFHPESRDFLKKVFFQYWLISCLIVLPIFLSFSINLMAGFGGRFSGFADIPFDPFFRTFWRVGVFSLSVYALVKILKIDIFLIIRLIFATAIIHALASIYLFYNNVLNFLFYGKDIRLYGSLGSPNELGVLMSVGIFAGLGLLIFDKSKAYYYKIICISMMLLLVFCLLLTQSRGAWLGFIIAFAAFLVMLLFYGNIRIAALVIFGFSAIAIVSYFFLDINMFLNRSSRFFEDSTRIAIWQYFLDVWKSHWFVGVYDLGDYNYLHTNKYIYKNPHSIFLDIMVRAGLVGICSFLLFLGAIFLRFIKARYSALLAALFLSIVVGTSFSFSIYAKEFAQSLYALLFILFLLSESNSLDTVNEKDNILQSVAEPAS